MFNYVFSVLPSYYLYKRTWAWSAWIELLWSLTVCVRCQSFDVRHPFRSSSLKLLVWFQNNKTLPQECSLSGPLSKLLNKRNYMSKFGCCSIRKKEIMTARWVMACFPFVYILKTIWPKVLFRFENNLAQINLEWPSKKIVLIQCGARLPYMNI